MLIPYTASEIMTIIQMYVRTCHLITVNDSNDSNKLIQNVSLMLCDYPEFMPNWLTPTTIREHFYNNGIDIKKLFSFNSMFNPLYMGSDTIEYANDHYHFYGFHTFIKNTPNLPPLPKI